MTDVVQDIGRAVLFFGGGYLLGSIPVAWLIAYIHMGRDLRQMGSGNVGVLNTALSVHRWAGLLVFIGELFKGIASVLVARQLGGGSEVLIGAAALGAFVGTRWPVWLRFHGGRGNTCAAASLALISPLTVVAMATLWFGMRIVGADNFVATRVMLAALPFALGLLTWSLWWFAVGVAYSVLFLTTHSPSTDDHMLLQAQYPSVWAFLTAPPRHQHSE